MFVKVLKICQAQSKCVVFGHNLAITSAIVVSPSVVITLGTVPKHSLNFVNTHEKKSFDSDSTNDAAMTCVFPNSSKVTKHPKANP